MIIIYKIKLKSDISNNLQYKYLLFNYIVYFIKLIVLIKLFNKYE